MSGDEQEDFYLVSVMEESTDTSGELNWKSVFQGISRRKYHLTDEIEKMAEMLLDASLTSCCDDDDVVLRFSKLYSFYLNFSWRRDTFFEKGSRGTLWYRNWNPVYTSSLLNSLIEPEPLGNPSSRNWQLGEWVALNVGHWKFLSAQVRYGRWYGLLDSMMSIQYADFRELLLYIRHITGELEEMSSDNIKLVWSKLTEDDGRMLSDNHRGFRRIRLIVRSLKAAVMHSEGHPLAKQYVKGLELYFVTMLDPEVSEEEVRELLLYILKKECHRQVVDRLMGAWIELFGRQKFTPRKLTHFCRNAVRNSLLENKSGLLPNHVESLDVPRVIKNFLLGTPVQKSL